MEGIELSVATALVAVKEWSHEVDKSHVVSAKLNGSFCEVRYAVRREGKSTWDNLTTQTQRALPDVLEAVHRLIRIAEFEAAPLVLETKP